MTKREKQISDLEAAIASPVTPEAQREQMRKMLEKLRGSTSVKKPVEKKKEKKPKVEKKAIAKALIRAFDRVSDKITMTSGGQLYSDDEMQKDMRYYMDREMKRFDRSQIDNSVFDYLEEENAHSLNNYLALSGYYSEDKKQEFINLHKDHTRMFLNPENFTGKARKMKSAEKKTIQKDEEDTKKKSGKYDCDELIEREKKRMSKLREAAKKRAKGPTKTPATKNKEAISKAAEKVTDNVFKRIEKGEVSKSELEKLIEETEELLDKLKAALKKL